MAASSTPQADHCSATAASTAAVTVAASVMPNPASCAATPGAIAARMDCVTT